MKQIKMYEEFYFQGEEETPSNSPSTSGGFTGWNVQDRGKAEVYFNMLPKGLRDELTRPVKDMLMNSNASDWHTLDYIMPKIEKLMSKSGLQWNRFPGLKGISGIKSIDNFIEWLEMGYYQALENAYFS